MALNIFREELKAFFANPPGREKGERFAEDSYCGLHC